MFDHIFKYLLQDILHEFFTFFMNKPISKTDLFLRIVQQPNFLTLKLSYWRQENIKFFSIPEENDKNTKSKIAWIKS